MSDSDDRPCRPRVLRRVRQLVLLLVAGGALLLAALLGLQTWLNSGLLPLERWHTVVPESEFSAKDASATFGFRDYLAREEALFRELDSYMLEPGDLQGQSEIVRFVRGGRGDPATFEPNWNRTIELTPRDGAVTGGVLLLHGLTDSPYSMRTIAELCAESGQLALCLRLPGHGAVPAGLRSVTVEDWIAAVRVAWRHLQERVGPGKPLTICGYSNGGALAVLFTMEELGPGGPGGAGVRVPDRLFLLSPAIGITPFAVATNFHQIHSWMPGFEKSQWLGVQPEYDPFKFNSFPKNAGAQSWRLARMIEQRLVRAVDDGSIARMPPIATFQSIVDSTVVARDIVTRLYDRLPANGSELVVFDVNRSSVLDGFYRDPRMPLEPLLANPSLNYSITVIGNDGRGAGTVSARHHPARSAEIVAEPLEARWPGQVFSLAHVAIPFSPADPLYGDAEAGEGSGRVPLGALSLRGERHVLVVSANDLMRLRHNPFHEYMMRRIRESLKPRRRRPSSRGRRPGAARRIGAGAALGACAALCICALSLLGGCTGLSNPSFPLTTDKAESELKKMAAAPKPAARPIVVVGGFADPGFASDAIRKSLAGCLEWPEILAFEMGGTDSFAEARRRIVKEVIAAYPDPGGDPMRSAEIDIVGNSMGGLVAADASLPRPGEPVLSTVRLFTIATPFRGAAAAEILPLNRMIEDMKPGSAFLESLDDASRPRSFELVPYVRHDDAFVGAANASPTGVTVWWAPGEFLHSGHLTAFDDPRFHADIARRLRGETPYTREPRTPLPHAERPST